MESDKIDPVEVGKRLTAARLAAGVNTQSEMADVVGVDKSTWSQYESGSRLITTRLAIKLLLRYGITLDYLYAGRPDTLMPAFRREVERHVK